MTTGFLRADFVTVNAMLQALTGADARRAAIDAAARSTLSDKDYKLFQAVMEAIKSSRKRRNEFAHYLWGYVEKMDDVLLLLDPKHIAEHKAEAERFKVDFMKPEFLSRDTKEKTEYPRLDRSLVQVYNSADLKEDIKRAKTSHSLLLMLRFALSDHPESDERRSELLGRPEIEQILQRQSNKNG